RVLFPLEVRARQVLLTQIHRIVYRGQHGKPLTAVRGEPIEILVDKSVFAVRHSVFSQITGAQISRYDLQRSDAWLRLLQADAETAGLRNLFPLRDRHALPRALGRELDSAEVEVKEPRLHAGIGLDLQHRLVLPRDRQ